MRTLRITEHIVEGNGTYQTHSNNIAQIICNERRLDSAEKLIDLYLRAVGVKEPKTTEYSS